jgi:two-component system, OmpR family, KDP operon response regulator KdpE
MNAKILIVDDEPQIRGVIRTALISEGFLTVEVRAAEEAFEKFREERFDLILLDVNLPGMSGLEACAEFRRGSDIAIVMLTVRNSEKDKIEALDAGADDYVTKPFSMPELLARVRASLHRVPYLAANGPAVIRFGNVEIHSETRHVLASRRARRPSYSQGIRSVALSRYSPERDNSPWEASANGLGTGLRE